MIMKLTVIIPIKVGTTNIKRRMMYAVIKIIAGVFQSYKIVRLNSDSAFYQAKSFVFPYQSTK